MSAPLSISLYFVNATRQLRFRRPRFSLSLSLSLSISPPSFFRLSGNSSFAADYSEPTDQRSCQVRSICSSILQFSIHFECSEAAAISKVQYWKLSTGHTTLDLKKPLPTLHDKCKFCQKLVKSTFMD